MGGAVERILRVAMARLPRVLRNQLQRWHYTRVVRRCAPSDELDLAMAVQIIRENDIVADVGANIGTYTRAFSDRVGPGGRVISVEPVRETFAFLEHSVRTLGLSNVVLVNAAASNREGYQRMSVPRDETGLPLHYQAHLGGTAPDGGRGAHVEEVYCNTLDEILREHAPVAFIKCDVEGHELDCIQGARAVIRRDRPALLIEVSGNPDDPGSSTSELFRLLAEEDYTVWLNEPGGLRRRTPGDRSVNYFFLQARHVSA